jgi:hypothetical protein
VYGFISNADPARVPSLIRDLPPAVRSDIEALDVAARNLSGLRATVILVHGLDDDVIPYTESVALAARRQPVETVPARWTASCPPTAAWTPGAWHMCCCCPKVAGDETMG